MVILCLLLPGRHQTPLIELRVKFQSNILVTLYKDNSIDNNNIIIISSLHVISDHNHSILPNQGGIILSCCYMKIHWNIFREKLLNCRSKHVSRTSKSAKVRPTREPLSNYTAEVESTSLIMKANISKEVTNKRQRAIQRTQKFKKIKKSPRHPTPHKTNTAIQRHHHYKRDLKDHCCP